MAEQQQRRGGRRRRRKKYVSSAQNHIDHLTTKTQIYSNVSFLKRENLTTSCNWDLREKHQRALTVAIKRARIMGLLPFTVQD